VRSILSLTCLLVITLGAPTVHGGEPIEDAFVNSGISITGGALEPASALLDPILQSQISASPQFNLLEILDLDDPQMQNDDEISVASVLGVDVDGDAANNFDGTNLFEVTPESVDDTGQPLIVFGSGSIVAGELTAGPADLQGPGGVSLPGITLQLTVEPGGTSAFTPGIPAAIPVAVFDAIPAPFPFDGFPFNYDTMTEVLEFVGIVVDTDLDADGVLDAFSVEFSLQFVSCELVYPDLSGSPFRRGDFGGDGTVDLSDSINMLSYLFTGGSEPGCMDSSDIDDNGLVDIADAVLLLGYLFTGGAPPASPHETCGEDTTTDPLECLIPHQGC
jgi:hypothetical protein